MPHHIWGDSWFEKYGNDLDKAISFCITNWERWGRIGSHGKEKYGNFRHHIYLFYGELPLWELCYPGYVSYRNWPKPLLYLDRYLFKYVFRYLGLGRLIRWYQSQVYNIVIQIACRRWPDIIDELVADSDMAGAIRPGLFGKVDGKAIHDKYWTKL